MGHIANSLLYTTLSVFAASGFVLLLGCKSLPTLEQQEQLVQRENLVLDQITSRAVVNAWGGPPFYHSEFAHFFVMPDLSLIPGSRVASGEVPKGWRGGVHAGEGVYFAYPDRGWLLVFFDEHLVYREKLQPDELRTLAKAWEYEARFRTGIDEVSRP
ncbi:MAG TPA: hypothetical protein PLO50_04190 [Nitrospira sp.]|nr:hypothetical protein [Nitrospira sp.]